ncbi:hypothetical protein KKE45_02075 [Patescibacteria group bacterium]|nr:hypothetical protein [Patescibacteria group bacterium]
MKLYFDKSNSPRLKTKTFISTWKTIDYLIDTGFSGGIALSEKYQKHFKKKPVAYQEFELANGSLVNFAIYKTKIKILKKSKEITLIFTKSADSLLGMEFLTDQKLILNLKNHKISLE